MKTRHIFLGFLFSFGFLSHGQIMTTTLTSYGNSAGTTGNQSAYFGYMAGAGGGGISTCIGNLAGKNNQGGANTFVGSQSGGGNNTITGGYNAFYGFYTGVALTTGQFNTFIGTNSGASNNSGSNNTALGYGAGVGISTGSNNVSIGYLAASGNSGGNTYNTIIGPGAGNDVNGSNNVMIGKNAGSSTVGSNLLFIDNTSTVSPLIWGNFSSNLLKFNGKVGVNFNTANLPNEAGGVLLGSYQLFVKGGILADEVRVTPQTAWADYVFEDDYALPTLEEVECYIEENGHLPNVPSAAQVKEEGIEVGQMATIQQEKIEELTLYVIEQNKQLKEQQEKIEKLEALVQGLIDTKQ